MGAPSAERNYKSTGYSIAYPEGKINNISCKRDIKFLRQFCLARLLQYRIKSSL